MEMHLLQFAFLPSLHVLTSPSAGSLTWFSLSILSAENMCSNMPNDSPHQRITQTRSLH